MLAKPNLKKLIEERYGSVYRFVQIATGIPKSTIYSVVKGGYTGNIRKQTARIIDALENREVDDKVFVAIKGAACSRCTSKGDCDWCDEVFAAQTRAVLNILSLGEKT